MSLMRTLACTALACISMWTLSACSQDRLVVQRTTGPNGLPQVTATNTLTGEAKVLAVDYHNRTIALEAEKGDSHIFTVPAYVRNFAQVKQGDKVKVKYEETLELTMRKVAEAPTMVTADTVARAPLGEKPGFTAYRFVKMTALVEAIDYQGRQVTLVGPTGNRVVFPVHKDVKAFPKVFKGDQVVIEYTETVEIFVAK